ncbi:MAG: MiaB/RimO family radical SAM methylthiotransferase [Planctomycetota bacterium]|nr:MAG: MiaB/RimO family radical SAM methylthiotransferase [Planctomycetota bacterium]
MTALRTCRLLTLGCKVNQYETQYVKELLEANGYREAQDRESADLCVVNTCTVTHEADAKGRQLIRRLAQENPRADIVVMGCFATRAPEIVASLPGVTRFGVNRPVRGIRRFDGHRRAFVKVQDGCLLNCTFCIIPRVRPIMRSRPLDEIAEEVSRLVDGGCQEIVLTGIHLGHYGIDLSRGKPKALWCRLWHLIRRLDALPGDFRLRLSSLEAAEVRGELVDALGASKRVCPHLHLCLQSGSDRILTLMKRRYRVAGFLERCRRLRQAFDLPAFSTDVIIGFPGETDRDFEATCRTVREVGFSKIHVFSYSPRQGTAAALLPNRVHPAVVAERRRRLRELEQELAGAYYRSLLGRQLDVLVEGAAPGRPGHVQGTSCRYAPVAFAGHLPALLARRVPVRATAVAGDVVLAHPEPVLQEEILEETHDRRISLPQLKFN